MKKDYWHAMTIEQQRKIIDSGITVGDLMEKYEQPEWCGYHQALAGKMGCWSLFGGFIHTESFCKYCEEYKPKP